MLRVCTYNIHKGFCSLNIRPVLSGLRTAIRSLDADLVFLQEVVGERSNSAAATHRSEHQHFIYPQFEYLADRIWPHHAYGRNAITQKGHHGNVIMSKTPFLEWHNTDVSQWRFSQRGVLLGKLSSGIYVACIHLGLFSWERKQQLNELLVLLTQKVPVEAPLIIAGDFNDWSKTLHSELTDSFQLKEAHHEVHGYLAKTFPARVPMLPVDRIYYRNLRVNAAEVPTGKPWQKLSDHKPLFASFDILIS